MAFISHPADESLPSWWNIESVDHTAYRTEVPPRDATRSLRGFVSSLLELNILCAVYTHQGAAVRGVGFLYRRPRNRLGTDIGYKNVVI